MRRFETVSVFLSAETEIEPGENFASAVAAIKRKVKSEVEEEIKNLKRERLETRDDEMEKSE